MRRLVFFWAVLIMAGVGVLSAGEPEDTWMKAISSGTVKAAWVGIEQGQIVSHGLEVIRNAGNEGVLTVANTGGQDIISVQEPDPKYTGPQFIYGNVPDWLRQVSRVEIVIEYFDAGPGTISINYNATILEFSTASTPIILTGTNRWRVARIALLDAAFRKKVNGCDFRILMNRKNFLVRTVAVLPLGELDKISANVH